MRTESLVNDEMHRRKIAEFFHRLGLNVNLEEWSVLCENKHISVLQTGNKRYDTFELVATIYVQQCHTNSVGGYLSDGITTSKGKLLLPASKSISSLG